MAERQPTLPDVEREESAETSGDREVVGVLVDSVKRRWCALREDGRRERWERSDKALRARIVLEYSMGRTAVRGVSSRP